MDPASAARLVASALSHLPPAQQEAATLALMRLKAARDARLIAVRPEYDNAHDALLARESLRVFVRQAWDLVEPVQAYRHNWHIDALCDALEALSRGEIQRLLINVSPGSMKSLLVSVFWPAWEWARNPSLRYLTASHSNALTIRDNLRTRDIVKSEWYRRWYWNDELARSIGVAAVDFRGDQNAKEKFNTTAQGWRIATGVGGPGTGEHPDRVIIDDPHTAEQARSDVERQRALDWFDRTISTRGVARGTRMVVIMQRLHERDLSGHLLQRGGWEHICWPMRYELERADRRDVRTHPGQLFWPALFPEEAVRQLEMDLGPYGTAGQLQQRPAPEGGGLFKPTWFEIVDEAPKQAVRCRGWDTAATADGGDWTVGVKMSRTPAGMIYVEDVVRGQLGPAAVDALILQTASFDGRGCRIREEQEAGASGATVIAARLRRLAGYDYRGVRTTGDKVTRVRPFRAQAEAGNVKLVRGAWNAAYLAELSVFPVGQHDDQVDASSAAFNELATGARPATTRDVNWG